MNTTKQYCTFYVDGLFFGVDVRQVQEVIRYQELTRVPLASRVIRGLMNLRGQIVTAIDLRLRLGLSERTGDQLPMNIIVRTDHGAASLLVDEIGDVQEVDQSNFESVPDTLCGEARTLIRGAYKLTDRLLLVLDTDKVVTLDTEMASLESPALLLAASSFSR